MPTVILANAVLDGGSSTASRYSQPVYRTAGVPTTYLIKVSLAAGVVAFTPQINIDTDGTNEVDWTDDTRIDVYSLTAEAALGKSNAAILASADRGGVLTNVADDQILLIEFTPSALYYRIRVDLEANTDATVTLIAVS